MVKVIFSDGLILPVRTRIKSMQVNRVKVSAIMLPVFFESHEEPSA
jgi:hypothetical protein